MIGYCSLIEYLNPEVTGLFDIRVFEEWTTNIEYVKYKNIGIEQKTETLILGSSTSEAYNPSDVNEIFKTKSYIASLGGADTPTRSVFFKEAIDRLPNLRRIIYVADFFEFNKDIAKPAVAFNKEMGSQLARYAKPGPLKFIRYYFNHQLFENAVNILKRKKKNKKIELSNNGAASRSMVLSSIQAQEGFESKINQEEKRKLTEYIIENYITYSKSVLDHYDKLNPTVVELYKEMIKKAQEKNIEIIFVLSPYHHDFRKRLMSMKGITERYSQWQKKLDEFGQETGVVVINGTNVLIANEPMSGAWRDGIHYSRPSAYTILNNGYSGKLP